MMLKKTLRHFPYAFTGIKIAWLEEINFKVHVVLAITALIGAWFLGISRTEFLFVVFMVGFVLTAEMFNTALEELWDKFQPEHDPHIAKIKDLAAAAVLISSITALIVGVTIYAPYILALTQWNS